MKARVTVTLKSGVLDPQGQAISGSLKSLGFAGVGSVRQGKVFDIEMGDADPVTARETLKAMCEKLLANTVIENYAIETTTAAPVAGVWPPPPPQPDPVEEPAAPLEADEAVADIVAMDEGLVVEQVPDMSLAAAVDEDLSEVPPMPEPVAVMTEDMPLPPELGEEEPAADEAPAAPVASPPAPEPPASEPVGIAAARSTTTPPWSSEPSSSSA